uniref:Bifunctional inhibitor/plant lipid transfer protein/seed storage helical domain-containing protein n=1 Tax=Chenopodium quinoa TaxID=63459 RepID=A0A803LAZ4_CHEQI
MANKMYTFALITVVVAAAMLAEAPILASAATCDISQLMSCAGAFLSQDVAPSGDCCNKFKEQRPCLCGYKKKYQSYANSPSAKRVISACGVKISC